MSTTIESYLNDGANWQTQSVLGYLRSIKESIVEKHGQTQIDAF